MEIEKGFWRNLIIIGSIILILFFVYYFSVSQNSDSNTNTYSSICEAGYTECNGQCFSCEKGYYLGTDCNCYPNEDTLYNQADSKWKQHSDILSNDAEKTNEAYNMYCVGVDMSGVPNCVDVVYPRLEVYATHIVSAQNFMLDKGNIFNNQQQLLSNLDEHSVYVKTLANSLDTAVNQYNSWVQAQQQQQAQDQQTAEALSNILKILAMAI